MSILVTFHDVIFYAKAKRWVVVMHKEMESLYKNEGWKLVKPLKCRSIVGCKWIFKKKITFILSDGRSCDRLST